MVVKKNNKITVEYEGRYDNKNGEIFDSSKDKEPLSFVCGMGMVVPGFDEAIIGMDKNEEKEIILKPEQAYGPYREELKQTVPKEMLPKEKEPEEGMMLMMQTPTGQVMPVTIKEVKEDSVILDLNHFLAGKTLYFKIKVIDYEEFDIEAMKKQMLEAQQGVCNCSEDDACQQEGGECNCEKEQAEEKDKSIEDLAEGK